MTETSVALSKHAVTLEYKKDKPVPLRVLRTTQAGLDFLDASYSSNTLMFHVSSELAITDDVNHDTTRIGYHEYDRSDYGVLVVKLTGVERIYTIIVEEEKIPYIDDMIKRHCGMKEFTVEVSHQTLLLDNLGARTPFSYSSKSVWPIASVLFWWADIGEVPKESNEK